MVGGVAWIITYSFYTFLEWFRYWFENLLSLLACKTELPHTLAYLPACLSNKSVRRCLLHGSWLTFITFYKTRRRLKSKVWREGQQDESFLSLDDDTFENKSLQGIQRANEILEFLCIDLTSTRTVPLFA